MDSIDHKVVPITVLTGFLGAGKTTLLNHILNGDHGLRVAVLVNDFGSINVDAEQVVGAESDVVSLADGCVCCSIRDDLLEAVRRVLDRPERPEYVLLEASGVADPAGIALAFTAVEIHDRIRLDSITCVVDAEQVFAYQEQPIVVRLKMMQIACADIMVLNKVDLAGPGGVAKVRAWLDENFGRIRLVEAVRGNVPLEILLGAGRFEPSAPADSRHGTDEGSGGKYAGQWDAHRHNGDRGHNHGTKFGTWSYETGRPVSLEALREMVRRELPASVYRCKGIVYAAETPERRAVLQVVGRRTDISFGSPWRGASPCTRIVAIGAPDALDSFGLRRLFERCLSPRRDV